MLMCMVAPFERVVAGTLCVLLVRLARVVDVAVTDRNKLAQFSATETVWTGFWKTGPRQPWFPQFCSYRIGPIGSVGGPSQ